MKTVGRLSTEYIGRPSQAETLPCLSIYRLDHLVRATGQGRPHTVTTNCNSRTITPSHHHQLKVISAISDGAIELSRTFPAPSTLTQTQASPKQTSTSRVIRGQHNLSAKLCAQIKDLLKAPVCQSQTSRFFYFRWLTSN